MSANAYVLDQCKILLFGKEVIVKDFKMSFILKCQLFMCHVSKYAGYYFEVIYPTPICAACILN